MPDEFDPYYKWLGIPPAEQPPNHYRLLGIQLFEADADVISNAADQRMAHVRTFQSGKFTKESQRILNEISTARVELLSPSKHDYDRKLRSSTAPTAAPSAAKPLAKAKPLPASRASAAPAEPRSRDSADTIEPVVNVAAPQRDMVHRRPERRTAWNNPALLGVAAVLILLLVAGVTFMLVGGSNETNVAVHPQLPPADNPSTTTPTPQPQNQTPSAPGPETHAPESRQKPPAPDPSPPETPSPPDGNGADQSSAEPTAPQTAPPTAGGSETAVPDNTDPKTAQPEASGIVYLDDLEETEFQVAMGTLGKHGASGYPAGHAITTVDFQNRRAVHALSTFPPSQSFAFVKHDVAGLYTSFAASVGIMDRFKDDFRSPRSPVVFEVVGDGKQLWQSDPISRYGQGQECSVAIDGVRELELRVNCAGSNYCSHCVWVEPRLERADAAKLERLAQRHAIPTADDLKKARALICEIFADQIAAAESDADKLALAKTWIQSASETKDDDAARYVLLQLAAQAAVNAGEVETAISAIDSMASYFDVDAWSLKISALTAISKAKGTDYKERNQQVADFAKALIETAVGASKFELADALLDVAMTSARSAKDVALVKELVVRKKEIDELAKAYEAAMEALAALKKDPADPNANLIAGRYFCFVKGDWPAGLSLLAKTDDPALKQVAEMELAAPSTSEEQVALGDAWRDLALAAGEGEGERLKQRATYWYLRALPNVTGLTRQKLMLQLDELAAGSKDGGGGPPRLPSHRVVCESLHAKGSPRNLIPEATPFGASRGDGRSGANGFLLNAPSGWQEHGTVWTCVYRRGGTARGVHFVHPVATGHIIVGVSNSNVSLYSSRSWPPRGDFKLQKSAEFNELFRLDETPHRLTSVVAADGTFRFYLDDALVAVGKATQAVPLELSEGFSGGGLPRALKPGEAAIVIGPMDNGVNDAREVAFATLQH